MQTAIRIVLGAAWWVLVVVAASAIAQCALGAAAFIIYASEESGVWPLAGSLFEAVAYALCLALFWVAGRSGAGAVTEFRLWPRPWWLISVPVTLWLAIAASANLETAAPLVGAVAMVVGQWMGWKRSVEVIGTDDAIRSAIATETRGH